LKQDFTLLVMLVDRSGSMKQCLADTVGGINSFFEKQAEETKGDVRGTLMFFNTLLETKFTMVPVKEIPEVDGGSFYPLGNTALVDLMCKSIDKTGTVLAAMAEHERPSRVIFVTITDGEENASWMRTNQDLKDRIEHQRSKYGWEFLYLGANQDSFHLSQKWGFPNGTQANWAYEDTRGTYKSLSNIVSSSINTGSVVDFSSNYDANKGLTGNAEETTKTEAK